MISTTIQSSDASKSFVLAPMYPLVVWMVIQAVIIPVSGQTISADAVARADVNAGETATDGDFPGMAVAVYHNGEIWQQGYGYANVEKKDPIDPAGSLFRVGSVSKTLTSAGLLKLYQDGQIALDTAVQVYVPDFPEKKYPVTVRQVAQHVAGIRHYRDMEFMSNIHYNSVSEGLQIFADDTLLFEPGAKFSYSSYGWNLISAVMESAAGEDFLSFMNKEVFDRAGMLNTSAEDVTQQIPGLVEFYNLQDSILVVAPPVDNSYKWAGGGFISTAGDLIRFGRMILEGTYLSDETMSEAWKPYVLNDGGETNYGLGWRVGRDKKDRLWVGHGGGSVGGSSMFVIYPEENLIVVTLVNLTRARTGNLAFRIAEQFLAGP